MPRPRHRRGRLSLRARWRHLIEAVVDLLLVD
jgi:hypothetical protein